MCGMVAILTSLLCPCTNRFVERVPEKMPDQRCATVGILQRWSTERSPSFASGLKGQDNCKHNKQDDYKRYPCHGGDESMSAVRANTCVQPDILLTCGARLHCGNVFSVTSGCQESLS